MPQLNNSNRLNKIPLTKPFLSDGIKKKVLEVLESGHWTEGDVTRELENSFKNYIECNNAIAVTSCTTGLEMALRVLGIGRGDDVIVPDFTHPATASIVAITGARVILVDVDPITYNIDYNALESVITDNTKAIIPVSLFGNPLDWEKLKFIKEKYSLYIIEDAACAIGAEFQGLKIGNQADISVFSLHPRKTITTGEGGIITTNNPDWANWMKSYKNFGAYVKQNNANPSFNMFGTNYKMSDILAAVGLDQINNVNFLLEKRKLLCEKYNQLLCDVNEVTLPQVTPGGKHAWQSYCVKVNNRNHIIKKMKEYGISVQIGTFALHRENAFQKGNHCYHKSSFNGSLHLFNHCLTLPLSFEMSLEDIEYVVENLQLSIKNCIACK